MSGIVCDTDTGALTINSVLLHTPAYCMVDLLELWGFGVEVRGTNTVIPLADGTDPNPVRITETHHTLDMAITGRRDRFGVLSAAPMLQLQANIDYLRANVVTPPAAPTSTVPASLLMPDGSTRTADIQVLGLDLGDHIAPYALEAFLHIVIPAGVFA